MRLIRKGDKVDKVNEFNEFNEFDKFDKVNKQRLCRFAASCAEEGLSICGFTSVFV